MKSKNQLEEELYQKLAIQFSESGAIEALMTHNLENFAHRYLETSHSKDIFCEKMGPTYLVKSIETDIQEALKWNNREVKIKLIELCKQFPGKDSKKINIQLLLETKFISSNRISCRSSINWDFPQFLSKEKEVSKEVEFQFEDLIELRNKHAALLEQVSEIF